MNGSKPEGDTWATGLRRRRGRNAGGDDDDDQDHDESGHDSSSQTNNNVEEGENDATGNTAFNQINNISRDGARDLNGRIERPGGSNALVPIDNGQFSSSVRDSGACGGVGVLMASSSAALGGTDRRPQSPIKPTAKQTLAGAATQSSATAEGGTVESTLVYSAAHDQRNRDANRRQSPSRVLARQYQILQTQAYLLLGLVSIGFATFLFFALPFAALIGLVLMAGSLAALVPVATEAIQTRYQMELQHPLGLLQYFPDSLRTMLTETSLHDFMTDNSSFMENRYLLLYFIPGLDPDQLMGYINQLPPRHRNALLQPGLGRLMPSVMNRLMRLDGNTNQTNSMNRANGGRSDMSTASGLTLEHEDGEVDEGSNEEVTLLEAIMNLRRTLGASSREEVDTAANMDSGANELMRGEAGAMSYPESSENLNSTPNVNTRIESVMEVHSDQPPIEETNENNDSYPRRVVVEFPPPNHVDPTTEGSSQQVNLQQEYDVEERVLSSAVSTAASNYSTMVSAVVSDGALEAVEPVSTLIIRGGSYAGAFFGLGGIGVTLFANGLVPQPLTIIMGSLSGFSSVTSSSGRSDVIGGQRTDSEVESSNISSRMVRRLFTASAFGFASAGLAYFVRNRVRTAILMKRETNNAGKKNKSDGDLTK